MIYVYTYSGSNSNLCAPYLSSTLWINPDYYSTISEIVERTIPPTQEIRKQSLGSFCNLLGSLNHLSHIHHTYHLPPAFIFTSHAISSDYITYYGHENSISKIEHSLIISMKAKLQELDINEYQEVVDDFDLKTVEGFISYSYTNVLRQRYFDNYDKLYPSLGLKSNLGHKTPQHIKELSKLQYLPHFYIWEKVVNLFEASKECRIDCNWLEKELLNYGNVKQVS